MRVWLLALAAAGCGFRPSDQIDAPGQGAHDGGHDAPLDAPLDEPIDAPNTAPGDAIGSAWWDMAFMTRLPLTITNGSNATLSSGYQVGMAYDLTKPPCSSMNASAHDDVRIAFGTTELARAIDDITPADRIWFPLAEPLAGGSSSVGEYWLYCNNGSAGAPAKGSADVFELYDAFDGPAIDASKWNVVNAAITNGELVCGAAESGVYSKTAQSTVNHAVDFAAVAPMAPRNNNQAWWGGYQNGTSDSQPWAIWYVLANAVNQIVPSTAVTSERNGSGVPLDPMEHSYSVERYGDQTVVFRYDDEPVQTYGSATLIAGSDSQVDIPPTLDVRLWNRGGNGSASFDWIRTRQAVNPPPTTSVGAPQME